MSRVFNKFNSAAKSTRISIFNKRFSSHITFKRVLNIQKTSKNYHTHDKNYFEGRTVKRKFSTFNSDDFYYNGEDTLSEDNQAYIEFDDSCHRMVLYPDTNDDILLKLNGSLSIQSVFDVINDNIGKLKHFHICQAILILWDLQQMYINNYINNLHKFDVKYSPEEMLNDYMKVIHSHKEFKKILVLLRKHSSMFSVNELSHTIFHLTKMGIGLDNDVMNTLIDIACDKLNNNPQDWTLNSISKYTSVLDNESNTLRTVLLARGPFPLILNELNKCSSLEDLFLITICFKNISHLMTKTTIAQYINKLNNFVESRKITSKDVSTIIKIMNFLNHPHWSKHNYENISVLCGLIKNSIQNMSATELIALHQVFQNHLAPATIIDPINKRAAVLLETIKNDDRISTYIKFPDLLFCQIVSSVSSKKNSYEKIAEMFLHHGFSSTLETIYKILRHLKISESQISKKFWERMVSEFYDKNMDDVIVLKICTKYLYFNNNLSASYRSRYFEKLMIEKMLNLQDSIISVIPWKYSRIVSFLLAYGLSHQDILQFDRMQGILNKLEDISNQLDPLSCLILSRGLHVSFYTTKYKTEKLSNKFVLQIDNILDKCLNRHLKDECSLVDLNVIFKSLVYRRARSDTDQFYELLNSYCKVTENLSSRIVRDVAYSLLAYSTVVPQFIDRLIDYIANENLNVMGETALKVLNMCYMLGYTPSNKDFFSSAIDVIDRDKESVHGLSLLQNHLALCYFECLPDNFVKYVFSMDFMERLDEEISNCYAKKYYPFRIRDQLMELNRAVCIELPQHEVPWFHEKYIQEKFSLVPFKKSILHEDVYNALLSLMERKETIKRQYISPYGYEVDFFIQLCNNKPVIYTSRNTKDVDLKKIAIFILNNNCFSKVFNKDAIGSSPKIQFVKKGPILLRKRHLEQMGFQVIEILPSLWNSMHMAEPKAKTDYLNKLIFKN